MAHLKKKSSEGFGFKSMGRWCIETYSTGVAMGISVNCPLMGVALNRIPYIHHVARLRILIHGMRL